MLAAVRRSGVTHALRAPISRSLITRSTPQQLLKWQQPIQEAAYPRQIYRSLHISSTLRAAEATQAQTAEAEPETPQRLTEFADLAMHGLVDRKIIQRITNNMNIKTMTDVQSLTINETLHGDDVLAQAKTGTGKTLAFLVPVIQNIMKNLKEQPTVNQRRRRTTGADIRAIIISPTRELAEQIAVEAEKVAYGTGVVVQTGVGGTQKREKLMKLRREGCHLLIGTPGRLKDLLSDPGSGVTAPRLSAFVLDEADRLLDDGFAPDIQEIQEFLPVRSEMDRQTLLFSATVPKEVMSMVRTIMKRDFRFLKTVNENEVPTHFKVPQKAVVLSGYENVFAAILEIAKNYNGQVANGAVEPRPFKAIVYFNSTCEVELASQLFFRMRKSIPRDHVLFNTRIYDLQSRLSQGRRTKNADNFRASKSAILVSSDVSARGMDFPEVTHVIQVGVARDQPSYIHRVGRTGRANKSGEGWLLIHPHEMKAYKTKLGSLPIQLDDTSLKTAKVDLKTENRQGDEGTLAMIQEVEDAMADVDDVVKEDAYKSQLGVLKSTIFRNDQMFEALNNLAVHGYGLPGPPRLSSALIQNLGVQGVPGVNGGSGLRPPRGDRIGGRRDDSFRPRRDDSFGSRSFNDRGPRRDRGLFGRGDRDGGSWMGRGRKN